MLVKFGGGGGGEETQEGLPIRGDEEKEGYETNNRVLRAMRNVER